MNEHSNVTQGETADDSVVTVVTVPADKAQAVIDFVESLDKGETDVQGHMISGGALGAFGATAAKKKLTTSTGCNYFPTGSIGHDMQCGDTDTIIA